MLDCWNNIETTLKFIYLHIFLATKNIINDGVDEPLFIIGFRKCLTNIKMQCLRIFFRLVYRIGNTSRHFNNSVPFAIWGKQTNYYSCIVSKTIFLHIINTKNFSKWLNPPSIKYGSTHGKGRKLYINIRITYTQKKKRNAAGLWLHKMVNVLDMNNSEMFSRMYKQTKMKKKKCLKFIFICLDRCKVILYMEKKCHCCLLSAENMENLKLYVSRMQRVQL